LTVEQTVEEWLRRMGEASDAERARERGGRRGGPPPSPPVVSSMEIVKRRAIPGRQVCALTYRDTDGNQWSWTIRLIEDEQGSWMVCGGGGGSGDGPERDQPWVNLAGSWGRYGLALGGPVGGRGAERAASARLRIGDRVLVDDLDRGVVLFVTSEPEAGSTASVELLARDGSILWRDELQLDD
jgi:hypothetical protein